MQTIPTTTGLQLALFKEWGHIVPLDLSGCLKIVGLLDSVQIIVIIILMFLVPGGPPLNQHGSAVNSTAIIFTWDPPAVEARNGVITGYSLIFLELATNSSSQYNQSGARIEAVIGQLHPYYDYECRIAAETFIGRGPYGEPFITRTLQDGQPVLLMSIILFHIILNVIMSIQYLLWLHAM